MVKASMQTYVFSSFSIMSILLSSSYFHSDVMIEYSKWEKIQENVALACAFMPHSPCTYHI